MIESVGGHSDGEEEGEEAETLERGKARVSWYKRTDNPQTIDVHDLEVVDRCGCVPYAWSLPLCLSFGVLVQVHLCMQDNCCARDSTLPLE